MSRYKKYRSDKALREAVEGYFAGISRTVDVMEERKTGELDKFGHFVKEWVPVCNDRGEVVRAREFVIPPTADGLCAHLEISRETWAKYCDKDLNPQFEEKNLGTSVTAAQYAAISAGTFDNLFIGDYWVINGVNWRIAAFDYYLGTGSTALTTHHAVIVPDTNLSTQKMNDTDTTTGGYVGSKMYKTGIGYEARVKVNNAFSGHVLTHQFYLSNAVTNGKVTGSTNVSQDVVLMSERNVYGQSIMSSECANGNHNPGWYTYDRTQFPLFALAPEFIQKQRSTYWLRDVVSASAFACVSADGGSAWNNASASSGVRPAFSIS